MTRFEVYRHTSPSGKSYVGWTGHGTAARWREHVKAAVEGSPFPLHRAIRKHGADAFSHETLEVMTTEAGAKRAEQLWIAELGTFGATGYNATRGGDGTKGRTYRHSPETRAKIAASSRGPRPAWIGARISKALTGKRLGPQRPEWIAKRVASRARKAGH
jgi:group I intron endonuclease